MKNLVRNTIFFVLITLLPCFLIAGSSSVTRYKTDSLTIEKMEQIILSKLSGRKGIDEKNKLLLLKTLHVLGIHSATEFESLFAEYLKPAIKQEKEICKGILKNYKKNNTLEAGIFNATYAANEENLKEIKKGIYFTQMGLVREMLEIKYGQEKQSIINGDYFYEEEDFSDE